MELPHKDKPSDFGIIKPKGAGKGSRISGFDINNPNWKKSKLWWRSKCCNAHVIIEEDEDGKQINSLTCKTCGNILRAEDINNN